MASTVNGAFSEFIKGKVNLDSDDTKKARSSRDNLISNIHTLGNKDKYIFSSIK